MLSTKIKIQAVKEILGSKFLIGASFNINQTITVKFQSVQSKLNTQEDAKCDLAKSSLKEFERT